MSEHESVNDQEVIALLESQKDTHITYPQELFEKRRHAFLHGVAALGVTLIAWSLLGSKGVIKISELTQLGIKILLTVAAVEVLAVSYVYRDKIRDFLIPPTPVAVSPQLQPYQQPTASNAVKASPYPTPSLAPSLTPEPSSTAVVLSTRFAPGASQPAGAAVQVTPTEDGPPYSYGLTKTPKPGGGQDNDNNQGNSTDSETKPDK